MRIRRLTPGIDDIKIYEVVTSLPARIHAVVLRQRECHFYFILFIESCIPFPLNSPPYILFIGLYNFQPHPHIFYTVIKV